MSSGKKYWAFISYSHQDASWGEWLHRALESYSVPANLVGQERGGTAIPRRLFPIFRDRDELASESDLGAVLRNALQQSRALIVICSPNSAKSRWVNEEILTFRALGGGRLFAIIIDGEPGSATAECFPPALREGPELVAADARPGGDGKAGAKLKLIAGLIGSSFDELRQRDASRARRSAALLVAAAMAVVVAVTGGWQWNTRLGEARLAAERRATELSTLRESARRSLLNGEVQAAQVALRRSLALEPDDPALLLMESMASRSVGALKAKFDGQPAKTRELRVDATGTLLLTTDERSHTRLWTFPDGVMSTVFPESEQDENLTFGASSFSFDGSQMLFVGDEAAYLQAARGGARIDLAPFEGLSKFRPSKPSHAFFLPDGTVVGNLFANTSSYVGRWNTEGEKLWQVVVPGQRHVISADEATVTVTTLAPGTFAIDTVETLNRKTLARVSSFKVSTKHAIEVSRTRDRVLSDWDIFALDGSRVATIGTQDAAPLRSFWSPSGKLILSLDRGTKASVWSAETGALLQTFPLAGRGGGSLAVDARDQYVAVLADTGEIAVYDLKSGTPLARFVDREGWPLDSQFPYIGDTTVVFSPDGRFLISGAESATLKVWDWQRAVPLWHRLRGHARSVESIAFSADSSTAATGSRDGTVRLWDVASGHERGVLRPKDAPEEAEVPAVEFLPDGRVVAGSTWAEAQVFEGARNQPLVFDKHALVIMDTIAIGVPPGGNRIVALSSDGYGATFAADALATPQPFGPAKPTHVTRLRFASQRPRVAIPLEDGRVRLLDVAGPNVVDVANLGNSSEPITHALISPGGESVAVALRGSAELRTIDGGTALLPGLTVNTNAMAFSGDGQQLGLACEDDSVRVWKLGAALADPLVLREELPVSEHESDTLGAPLSDDPQVARYGFSAIVFSRDGRFVIGGNTLGRICIWDLTTGQQILRLKAFETSRVLDLALAPDGRHLGAANEDGTAVIIDLPLQ